MLWNIKKLVKVLEKNESNVRIALDRYSVRRIREGQRTFYEVDYKIIKKLKFFLENKKDLN